MPKLPRDLDGAELVKMLRRFGYAEIRQTGSHIRLTFSKGSKRHNMTIPAHSPLKIGTLNAILDDVASFSEIDKDELLRKLLE
jgi:predicted RNA binding protein YcfA (HicA-like mRNA interferase family)